MGTKSSQSKRISMLLTLACLAGMLSPLQVGASSGEGLAVEPQQALLDEVPSTHYDSILYSEIGPRLREIEQASPRVKVDVIGQSAGGHDLYLVTLSDPQSMGRLGRYMALRNLMVKDPERALELIDQFEDFKVPFFINGSIHGNEYPGTDAAIRLIETLAFDNSPEVQAILDNIILLVNVVQNPDGRILGTRGNANGFDINRDFITQSQPETRATVDVITRWNPMVLLDLHGFVNPMLIEPCTPLHNPNYEYDLYIQWAYYEAEAMEAELLAQTGFQAQIPFRDSDLGWDDWPPTYTPMYAMYHGAYGHTLETPYQDERGVDAHYWAVWGALKFAAQNREEMVRDQIEIFRRGFLALPQMLIPDELLSETQFDQYNELTIQEFPAAYIIPAGEPAQPSAHQAARLVSFLIDNDVQVEKTVQDFSFNENTYPAGSYIVWMDQPKRGLANTILESGDDLSGLEGLTFYSPPSVWSNPLLWGVTRAVMEEKIELETVRVDGVPGLQGWVEAGPAQAYAFLPTSLAAYQAANDLLSDGSRLYRAPRSFEDAGRAFGPGAFVMEADPILASFVSNRYALGVFALQSFPSGLAQLSLPRIAVYADEGALHALRLLGFDPAALSSSDLSSGRLLDYDFFVNQGASWRSLGRPGRTSVTQFFASGGDYLGLGSTGAQFAIDAGVLDATAAGGSGNAIVELTYDPEDSLAGGFPQGDYAFVYNPVWFSGLGENVEVTASLLGGDFLVSGFWPGWQESSAAGSPVIIHERAGLSDVVALGIDATFRGHPENAFRLLGAAIFDAHR